MTKILYRGTLIFASMLLAACQNLAPPFQEAITEPSTSDTWVLIHHIEVSQNSIYLQASSIQSDADNAHLRSFNLLLNQEVAQPPSSIARYTFDCQTKRYRLEGIDFYSEAMAQGELIKSVTASNPSFFPLSAKSYLLETAYPIVCAKD